ncbi:MAG: DUF899 domain-containing protein [Rhizobiales bacterium]|nr:DUF899 domain-containing protein [Hyphomicrobiales bacterium]
MSEIITATKNEWLEARRELLKAEKALTHENDKVAAQRRALPWVKIDKQYMFETETGEVSFADLFGDKSQLIIYHFMMGEDWQEGCKSCSFWADTYNGLSGHLGAQDIAFVAISKATIRKIELFKNRMGWGFDWVSSAPNNFNADFNVGFGDHYDMPERMTYNFKQIDNIQMDEMHGTSVFAKDDKGNVYHTYSTYGRGLDATNAAYRYIDLTPKGRMEPKEGNPMVWVKHHDKY